MTRSLNSLVAALVFVLCAANAADQVSRQWSNMSFQDIQVSPFKWQGTSPNAYTCDVRDGGEPGAKQCNFYLWWTLGSKEVSIAGNVSWFEQEPGSACEATLARHCSPGNESRYMLTGYGKAAMVFIIPDVFGGGGRTAFGELEAQRASMLRILDDIVARIEPYAIPCTCNGQPTGNQPKRTRDGQHKPPPDSDSDLGLPPPAAPPAVVVKPGGDPLGQGDDAPCIKGMPDCPGDGKAYRKAGGFPPGVTVTSLKFFPSVAGLPPKSERAYATRFGSGLQYIYVELGLAYPQIKTRVDFDMEVDITRNGLPFAHFTQGGMSLEPGWIESHHSAGWGKSSGDYWEPDWYYVEVLIAGEVVAKGQFEVVASPP